MREQQKSKLERKGEGASHEVAKTRLVKVLMNCGWEVFPDHKFSVFCYMDSTDGCTEKYKDYYHEWDIYCRKDHDNGLMSEKIFEIDGSSHEKKKQQNRDDTAEKYAEFFLPNCNLYRIDIADLIGKHSLDDAKLWILYKLR